MAVQRASIYSTSLQMQLLDMQADMMTLDTNQGAEQNNTRDHRLNLISICSIITLKENRYFLWNISVMFLIQHQVSRQTEVLRVHKRVHISQYQSIWFHRWYLLGRTQPDALIRKQQESVKHRAFYKNWDTPSHVGSWEQRGH